MTVAAAAVAVAVASPSDWSAHYHQLEAGSCLAHEEACEASADAVIWESLMTTVSEAVILVQKNSEVEFGNYFAEVVIWGVGAVVEHGASEHLMQQLLMMLLLQ